MISAILIFCAGAFRGYSELVGFHHDDTIFSGKKAPTSFFGSRQYLRKYKVVSWRNADLNFFLDAGATVQRPLNNWYYKLFSIRYKERFPLSATMLVVFTDSFHLSNFLMSMSFVTALYFAEGHNLIMIPVYLLAWHTGFFTTFNFIFRKR